MQSNHAFYRSLSIWLLCLTIFLIPSNLFVKFAVNTAYVHGLLVDYLLPKLYASDLPILGIFVVWLSEIWQERKRFSVGKKWIPAILIGALFFLRQFFTDDPIASIWFFSKLCEIFLLVIFLLRHRTLLTSKKISFALAATLVFQSLVGMYQSFFQRSLFPSYLFFGEPNFSHPLGLAKSNFGGSLNILPYGTTTHPNVLAGFLVIGMLILIGNWQKKYLPKVFLLTTIFISFFALLLTQSLSAFLCFACGLFAIFVAPQLIKKIPHILEIIIVAILILAPIFIHFILPMYPDNPSLIRREVLNQAAIQMFVNNPVTGVGLNNFTEEVEKYASSNEVVRFVQPAHHIGLLWLAETGILGAGLIAYIIFTQRKKFFTTQNLLKIFTLLPLITLDHYLITQQIGLLIAVFFIALSL